MLGSAEIVKGFKRSQLLGDCWLIDKRSGASIAFCHIDGLERGVLNVGFEKSLHPLILHILTATSDLSFHLS